MTRASHAPMALTMSDVGHHHTDCLTLGSARVKQPPVSQVTEHSVEHGLPHSEASLAAPQLAMRLDHVSIGIPGAMNDDGTIERIIICRVKTHEPLRPAMFANIIVSGQKGTLA